MKVRYVGPTRGVMTLTDGKVYECLGVEYGFLRIIDDEGYSYWEKEKDEADGYLYAPVGVFASEDGSSVGRFEIVEDDEEQTLKKLMEKYQE